jgi:hypothetical protein
VALGGGAALAGGGLGRRRVARALGQQVGGLPRLAFVALAGWLPRPLRRPARPIGGPLALAHQQLVHLLHLQVLARLVAQAARGQLVAFGGQHAVHNDVGGHVPQLRLAPAAPLHVQQGRVQHLVQQQRVVLGRRKRGDERRVHKDVAPVGGGGGDLLAGLEARPQRERGQKRVALAHARQRGADGAGGLLVE